ncbi:MAG TPA: O-antigen ligase family protein [Terriglobia bacterium]|nr:O-antigen ligase family protein [Terriglobia bacterium]
MERSAKETWLFGLTLASAACTLISIAASEILGAAACLLWIALRPGRPRVPRYVIPLVLFMLATIASLAMSPDPSRGGAQINKFVLFPMGLLAANFVSTAARAKWTYRALMLAAAASSIVAIVQFVLGYLHFKQTGDYADNPVILARATGFMGHWMTFSVGEMLVWLGALPAVATLGWRWGAPVTVIGAGIVLSFTRGVWIGSMAGFLAVVSALPRKLLVALMVPVALVALIAAKPIYQRVSMSFGADFAPDAGRMALLKAGALMVRDHPLFGVGPDRIHDEFPGYYTGHIDLQNFFYGHMENNFMQIAAERGLVALAAFVWFMAEIFLGLWKLRRSADDLVRMAALSGLAALTGFLVAGLFSYDFGDSESLLLFLFVVSIPFGLASREESRSII